jgi:diguanylate cyclase (GGDEF)-like protein/PAS domain S-box-containing protein
MMVTLRTGKSCSQVLMGVYNVHLGQRRWISINSRPIPTLSGTGDQPARVVVSFDDVTERIERENKLRRWSIVFRYSGEAIVITNEAGMIQDVNEGFERLVKAGKEVWLDRHIAELTSEGRSEGLFESSIWPTLESNDGWRGELWLRDSQGGIQATWAAITKVKQSLTSEVSYTLILSDFSERSLQEENLRYYASHDSLTGLPNRLLLNDRFAVAVKTAKRRKRGFACFYFDLNGFKPINDRYGHAVGDIVLQFVARKVSKVVRSVDTVSRIGGDEFFAIISGLESENDYRELAIRVAREVGSGMVIEGDEISVGVSIGIALYPDHGTSLEALMKASDVAMYDAKRRAVTVEFASSLDP